ncbi:LapA family protein [Rhodoferax sp.]|uniref:LapA family protein n=1 Tax=Rhodoferax sp. TaxID=50421 RepID=UPI00284B0E06|nr:LapA family protein [Rhodoferax sp.]MDR3370739.1 LapA family protein [Rhodoferax sp.]
MNKLIWLLKWLLKAAIFFTLFAFALNNQQDTTVHFFFGNQWQAPQVLVVLTAFAAGVAVGVLGMVPWWWRQRRLAIATPPMTAPTQTSPAPLGAPEASQATAPAYADGI